ncbi:MAG: NUDIX domain-containing protein [Arcobacter sp.]|nr:NUDIX domain-containing protein [Arcobacter sp.]
MQQVKAYGVLVYKIEKYTIKVLLCKSVKSLNKWGCLKGIQTSNESSKECARREFKEESGINVDSSSFENYFFQNNKEKYIGIWLVNSNNIDKLNKYFYEDNLHDNFLSWENSKVKFFDINNLPSIKSKQNFLVDNIKDFLQSKNQLH